MRKRLPGLRLVVLLLFMVGLLSPFAATGAGAQDLTCDQFNSQRAAQAVLEADPSLEESLDADGDGIACNEDEPTEEATEEPTDDPTEEATEEPTDDPTEEPTDDPTEEATDEPSGDVGAYLEDIQAEVDALQEQVDRFLEISELGADTTPDDAAELNEIAADWVDYPDVAADVEATEGYEDIHEAYLDLADTIGEAGELWEVYWTIPAANDDDEEVAIDEFNVAFIDAQDQIVALDALIQDAGGSTTPSDDPTEEATEEPTDDPTEEPSDDPSDDPTEEPADDPTEVPTDDPTEEPTDDPVDEPSGDADTYLANIQNEVDTVIESFDRQLEINTTIADASSSEQQELIGELEDLAATWSEYPDVAAEFEAPAGLEDVEDVYLDFADLVGEAGDTWLIWWVIPSGDPEEDAALDEFTETFDAAYDAADDVTAAIEDADGSVTPTDDPTEEATEEPNDDPTEEPTDDPTEEATEEPTDDPTEEATEEPADDGDAYVEDVQAELDTLTDEVDAFSATFELGADVTQDDADELNDLAATWVEYPDVAAELVAPAGYEDIEDAFLDLADTAGEAGELWEAYWAIDADLDDEETAALDAFNAAFADVQDQIGNVQDLLDDTGGSTGPSNDDPTKEPTEDPLEQPTEEATEEPSGDSDEYLSTVSDTAADWQDSIDRFSEIIGLGADATDAEFTELTDILIAWAEAPDVAAELDAPSGLEDVQAAYEDFADELSVASVSIDDYLGADPESPEAEAAFDDFITAIGNAEDLSAELDDLLADAGA